MKRIVVTGANGYIGRYVLPALLRRGFEVHALSRRNLSDLAIVWHKVDLLQHSLSSFFEEVKPTHLLHLAWCTEHGKFWTSEQNEVWLRTSIELVKNFHSCGGRRFVSAGSCAEYGISTNKCVEGVTPERPETVYGKCKKEFWDFVAQYSTNGLSSASGRIFFSFGPGEPRARLIPYVISTLLKDKQTAKCSDGNQVRDFLFIDDLGDAMASLVDSEVEGVVNIGSGVPVKIKDIVVLAAEALHARDRISFGDVPRAEGDPEIWTAETKRLNQEVGWTPRFSLADGLQLTIESLERELVQ